MTTAIAQAPSITVISPDMPPAGAYLWRCSVNDYHRLIEVGILKEEEPIELIEGWLRYKMSRDSRHDGRLGLMRRSIEKLLTPGWITRIQCAVTLADSEPEPDIAVVSGTEENFIDHHPGPTEIGLIVEVSNTSLLFDRTDKWRIYARAGITHYWIVNLDAALVECYSDPTGYDPTPSYRQRQVYRPGDSIPLILAGQSVGDIAVSDLNL